MENCYYAREHVQTHEGTRATSRGCKKGFGVEREKQRRCFGKTSAYKGENNGVDFMSE